MIRNTYSSFLPQSKNQTLLFMRNHKITSIFIFCKKGC